MAVADIAVGVAGCHQISAHEVTVICPGGFGIGYKGRALAGSSSLDTAPVTGSLLFNAPVCRLAVYCAAGFSSCVFIGGCDSIWLAVFGLFFRRVSVDFVMATDGDATAGARSGIIFGVTLDVPWNAPEAIVHLHSDGVVDLDTVPDVLGLTGRRLEPAVVRVMQGRDDQSVRALDSRSTGPGEGISRRDYREYGGFTRAVGSSGQ